MFIGPTLVVECPACAAPARLFEFASGNTSNGEHWSDGYAEYPMLRPAKFVSRCPTCAVFFFITDARVLGAVDREDPPAQPAWRTAGFLEKLAGEEWLDAIDAGVATTRARELLLRRQALWTSNAPHHKDPATWIEFAARSPRERANVVALLGLLDPGDPDEALLRAELLRELGRFAEALAAARSLAAIGDPNSAAAKIARLAETQVSAVRLLTPPRETRQEGHIRRLRMCDERLAKEPDNARLHFMRAAALEPLGCPDDALAAYQRVIDLDRFSEWAAGSHCRSGVILLKLGRGEEALVRFAAAIAADPDNYDNYVRVLEAQREAGHADAAARTRAAVLDLRRRSLDPRVRDLRAYAFDRLEGIHGALAQAHETLEPAEDRHDLYTFKVRDFDDRLLMSLHLEPGTGSARYVLVVTKGDQRTTTTVLFDELPDYKTLRSRVVEVLLARPGMW